MGAPLTAQASIVFAEQAMVTPAGDASRERAARTCEDATRVHPDFADAWNNLAQVRLELAQLSAAREAAARAWLLTSAMQPIP